MALVYLLKHLISFPQYPRYFVDRLYLPYLLSPLWRWRGLILGRGITWYGVPIVILEPASAISIGDQCVLCSRSNQTALGVNHPVVLRTLRPGAEIIIGKGVGISGTTVCSAVRVVIGDRCKIGANVTIVDTDFHSLDPIIRASPEDGRAAKAKDVEIGRDVFIGGGAYILKGVRIGNGAVIGAASVVTRDVPEFTVVAGNPARPVGKVER